jgi:GNAT superfamily N-acetyltransferase
MATPSSHIEIRDALPADRAAIEALTRAAYAEMATTMSPETWRGFHGAMSALLADPGDGQCIIAVDGDRVVGSVFLFGAGSMAYDDGVPLAAPEFRLLAVSPLARGAGVGRALVDECVRRAREADARELGLHTSRSFAAALAMYRAMGFVRAPERDFQPPGNTELVEGYRLPL